MNNCQQEVDTLPPVSYRSLFSFFCFFLLKYEVKRSGSLSMNISKEVPCQLPHVAMCSSPAANIEVN